jgi:hypothetical protein
MTNFDKEFDSPKDKRREKFLHKKTQSDKIQDFDDVKRKNIIKKELKKTKEKYQEEEWEDWDRFYNR